MTVKKSPNVALLVHSCDRYQFLYKGFGFFFDKYWPKEINCKKYFATEQLNIVLPSFELIQSGTGEWSDRLRTLLLKIKEPYILYFQEDMWLNKPVEARFFEQLFELCEQQNWQQVKLHSSEVYKTIPTDFFIEGFAVGKLDNTASDFLMSHQVTLWNREFLIQQMSKSEHPWRNERRGSRRLRKLNPDIYLIDYFAENGKPAINQNKPNLLRSAYYTVSENSTLNGFTLPFIEELQHGSSEDRQYALQLKEHYDKNLTHDGLSKPRKEDVFKKIKRLLKG